MLKQRVKKVKIKKSKVKKQKEEPECSAFFDFLILTFNFLLS